jgi:hypothetical protein
LSVEKRSLFEKNRQFWRKTFGQQIIEAYNNEEIDVLNSSEDENFDPATDDSDSFVTF